MTRRFLVVATLMLAVAAVLIVKGRTRDSVEPAAPAAAAALPRLVDLGADKCIPCKMMAPILEELRTDYAGRLEVEFIDVWKQKEKAQEYGIRVIPTQILYDPDGNELMRHEGFFSREDILAAWAQHGYDFDAGS